MKHFLYVFLGFVVIVLLSACGDRKPTVTTQEASIAFEDSLYDFGSMKHSDAVAKHTFVFHNTGVEPLVIRKVDTSCHCSTAEFTKTPIASGESGEIVVSYDPSSTAYGVFEKTVYVYSNTREGLDKLTIKGRIEVD